MSHAHTLVAPSNAQLPAAATAVDEGLVDLMPAGVTHQDHALAGLAGRPPAPSPRRPRLRASARGEASGLSLDHLPEPQQQANGLWRVRVRRAGRDIVIKNQPTRQEALRQAHKHVQALLSPRAPKGKGPSRTTLAEALQAYAFHHLPQLEGSKQECDRINRYLRAAALATLDVTETPDDSRERAGGIFCTVKLVPYTPERVIPKSLQAHRQQLLSDSAKSDAVRAWLAHRCVADITRADMQRLIDAMKKDGKSPSTQCKEQALLRKFFNFADNHWNWKLPDNPATKLHIDDADNARERVLTTQEQSRLEHALGQYANPEVLPAVTLLRECGMRSSETLRRATWEDVDWDKRTIQLRRAKGGKRKVPLSQPALQALEQLRSLSGGNEKARLLKSTYEALKKAWKLSCTKAGVEDCKLHDLRHTAATRMMLSSGNVGLVMALTGHKTLTSLKRYINIHADDVVAFMREQEAALAQQPSGDSASAPSAAAAAAAVDSQQVSSLISALLQLLPQPQPASVAEPGAQALPSTAPTAAPRLAPAGLADLGASLAQRLAAQHAAKPPLGVVRQAA